MDRERALWFGVIAQGVEDIQKCPLDSTEYVQASTFFLHDGPWGDRRQEIAEYVDLHGDDLKRIGLRVVNARRLETGLPPLTGKESRFVPAKLRPEAPPAHQGAPGRVAAASAMPAVLAQCLPRRHGGGTIRPPAANPFHPDYRRASRDQGTENTLLPPPGAVVLGGLYERDRTTSVGGKQAGTAALYRG